MECARNKVSHSTTRVSKMKNPVKGLSKVAAVIDYPRDMNHLDDFLFFPILDLEKGVLICRVRSVG